MSMRLPISIQRRLAVSITLVLVLSLVVGFGLTYGHVLTKVRTETQAALAVGADGARNALDSADAAADQILVLRRIVADFDGDRHVRATLRAADGALLAQSHLAAPDDAAPRWFYHFVDSPAASRVIALPPTFTRIGSLVLTTDPHNEVAEAWSDARLTLLIMAVFFAMVLALAFFIIKAALAPIREVGDALIRVGAGDYSARIAQHYARELEPLREGFNRMAQRLEDMEVQNRALNDQILNLQEEERAELARDLHDDVAPFLFAVGADAAMIRQYLAKGDMDAAQPRAEAIGEAVKHMQRHVKDALRRLAPGALLDLGLPGAIDDLAGFWRMRRPQIAFRVQISGDPLDPPLDAVAFRIVQESVSNAIRHGEPTSIEVTIDVDDETAAIVVEDDGSGLPAARPPRGFGLTGMQERARSVGGSIKVGNRAMSHGVRVEALLPVRRTIAGEVAQDDVAQDAIAQDMELPA